MEIRTINKRGGKKDVTMTRLQNGHRILNQMFITQ